MELTSEQIVTRILSRKSILNKNNNLFYASNPNYDLSGYLKNPAKIRYQGKYVFVNPIETL